MSTTYDLGCITCSERIWIGFDERLFASPSQHRLHEAFLFKHVGHSLVFDKSERLAATTFMERSEETSSPQKGNGMPVRYQLHITSEDGTYGQVAQREFLSPPPHNDMSAWIKSMAETCQIPASHRTLTVVQENSPKFLTFADMPPTFDPIFLAKKEP